MSITAIQKHVAVLEEASLVVKRRQGREQRVMAQPDTITGAQKLLDAYEELWRERADRMSILLTEAGDNK